MGLQVCVFRDKLNPHILGLGYENNWCWMYIIGCSFLENEFARGEGKEKGE
jgi:hypothetical protein